MSNDKYIEKVRSSSDSYTRLLLEENTILREAMETLQAENTRLTDELASHSRSGVSLRERLDVLETDRSKRDRDYALVARQNANLTSLYVASLGIHAALDRALVIGGIEEIVINLVGSEQYVLMERSLDSGELVCVASMGIATAMLPALASDPIVALALCGQSVFEGSVGEQPIIACVPLRLGGDIHGALLILTLLPQKAALEEIDHEILELISSEAGMALYCSALHERHAASVNV